MVFKITVKTLDSHNYQFEVDDEWTVSQFKDHIQSVVNVSSNEQRLIFCGRVLQDEEKINSYDCNGKVIHLVSRPPPPVGGSTGESTNADTNNNNQDSSSNGPHENVRFLDESNVSFSAMTLGPEANVQHILRHMVTLQQAIVTRTLSDGTAISTTLEPMSMTDIDRHLHNASRLLRITVNTINECMTRIAALPPSSASPTTERQNLAPTRHVITSASSHTDLQMDDSEYRGSPSQPPPATASVDDLSVGASNEAASQRTSTRQSLTTDDLPQSTERTLPRLAPTRPRTEDRERTLTTRQRGESELDRYLSILNYSCDLQNQFQGLARRYRQLIDISRRGGLIVPQSSAADSPNETSTETSSGNTQTQQQNTISSSLLNEARILGLYIPRIMHHISHLQHALSDFSVDFNRGRLLLCVSSRGSSRQQQTEVRTNSSQSNVPVAQNDTSSSLLNRQNRPRMFARRSVPLPVQPEGPANLSGTARRAAPHEFIRFSTPTQPNPIRAPPIQPTSQQSTASNSTQTVNRPYGVISGRIPLPFDYFLPCFSPWATMAYNVSNRSALPDGISATIQWRTNTNETAGTNQSERVVIPTVSNVTISTGGINQSNNQPAAEIGLSEVVSNIVGSIIRPQQRDQNQQANSTGTTNNQNQDPLINIIPELALNAVSHILGGVFGIPTGTQQQSGTTNTGQQQSTLPSVSPIMMEIDIDDSSSSQSESRYQDARESNSPSIAAPSFQFSRPTSSSHQASAPQASQSRSTSSSARYDRRQLAEVMQNHPDWLPIIEADINVMERQHQQSTTSGTQPFFSDAYLSSIPRKRRRLLTASPERVLILQPSPSQAISNLLRRAITSSSSSSVESLDNVLSAISNDSDLQSAYEEYIRSAVEVRLKTDYDYSPRKFENSSKYFR